LPPAARAWVRVQVGPRSRIVSERPRSGGTSSAVHAVTVEDGRGRRHALVLRRFVRAEWLAREPDLAEHEARVLDLLDGTDVAAPRLVAVDPHGAECDVPAVLMTRRAAYDPAWDLVTAVGMLDETGPASGWLRALDDVVARAVDRLATR
jgi:aminoglycoside phosphotransferase (APT) family kinase protein